MMVRIPFTVLGKVWTLRLLKKKKYKQKNGSDSVAVTKAYKRTIDLGPNGMDKETLVHELWHAFLAECCTFSADLTIEAFEEICAELMAKRGQEILDTAEELLNSMQNPPNQA
jgi:hypothetical protein